MNLGRKVLILNADFRAMAVCSVQKAFMLVFLQKAEIVHRAEDAILRTVSRSYPMPSVIRLLSYAPVPYKGVMMNRQNIYKRDGHNCQYCGSRDNLTLDHVLPSSRGGKSSWTNLVTACRRCNSLKGDRTPEEANMLLRQKPYRPSFVVFLREFMKSDKSWDVFLKNA